MSMMSVLGWGHEIRAKSITWILSVIQDAGSFKHFYRRVFTPLFVVFKRLTSIIASDNILNMP